MNALYLTLIACLVGCIGRMLAVQSRDRSRAAAALVRARNRGVLHGMNLGWIHHGRAMAQIRRAPVHGYAMECGKCERVFGIVAPTADEYWSCSECGHRNPAPLVAEDPCLLVSVSGIPLKR